MPKFAALDTKFLLALAGGESDAESTIDYLHQTGFFPIITESVIEQLGELRRNGEAQARENANYAAQWLPTWNILQDGNSYTSNGTSQIHAERILEQGLIPSATQMEAEILVEASCHNCDLLVTFSKALLEAPSAPLNLALMENDLNKVTVTIASPTIIAQRLQLLTTQAL
jgi:hypothetical protein